MTYGKLNGHVTDDHVIAKGQTRDSTICLERNISKTAEHAI